MALANYGSASDLDKVDLRRLVALQDRRGYRGHHPTDGRQIGNAPWPSRADSHFSLELVDATRP
jgi:hypothetical protein